MITVIIGTNRVGSRSRVLARHLMDMYAATGMEAQLVDLADLPMEVLSPQAYTEKPAGYAEAFIDPVIESSGLHMVVPEYNGSFPGVLKLFIDMLPHPEALTLRPIAYIGLSAGQFGALRSVEHLQQALGYRNAFNFPERVFMPMAYREFDADDVLINDELAERIRRQARGFARFVEAVEPIRKNTET